MKRVWLSNCFSVGLFILTLTGHAASVAPTVIDRGETLQGSFSERQPSVASFKGIPYARPPVGALRWQAPKAPHHRSGVQQATQWAPACYQDEYNLVWYQKIATQFGSDSPGFSNPPVSEDCLYLNVWSASLQPQSKQPVLVWIHGGSNKAGWSFEPNYNGEQLAAQGVVVVSVGYRLGIFGFFGHPQLKNQSLPTNFGLLDQIAALRWVQTHIDRFGGDPHNVTIAGESAGAADVSYLLASPMAKGLFHRAISESGGYMLSSKRALRDAESIGTRLASALPDKPTLAGLRALSSAALFETAKRVLAKQDYGPVTDGVSVREPISQSYQAHGIGVDMLIGTNENEWYMYVDDRPETLAATLAAVPASARQPLQQRAALEPSTQHANDRVSALIEMHCPAYVMAKATAAGGHRAYVYRFTRVRPGPGGQALLAYHGAEIPYLFDSHDAWLPKTVEDRVLTDAMVRYWSNFVRSGDPNGHDNAPWAAFDAKQPRVQELGTHIGAIAAPDYALCQQLEPLLYQ
jgi:para-nitrobenzyl esterase